MKLYIYGGVNRRIINEAVAESCCWGRSDWPREWPPSISMAIRHAKPFLRLQTVAAVVAAEAERDSNRIQSFWNMLLRWMGVSFQLAAAVAAADDVHRTEPSYCGPGTFLYGVSEP